MGITQRPFGKYDAELLENLAHDLEILGLEIHTASPRPIPDGAYNSLRRQYRAEAFLATARRDADEHLLSITNRDIYADDLNFVFGLARQVDRTAVISLARLVLDGDTDIHRRRILKEAVHELGHTFGLGHCLKPSCVMHFSNCLDDTDRKGKEYCPECSAKLRELSFSLRI